MNRYIDQRIAEVNTDLQEGQNMLGHNNPPSERQVPFAQLARRCIYRRTDLTDSEKLTFCMISDTMAPYGQQTKQIATAYLQQMAGDAAAHERTYRRHIDKLATQGALQKEAVKGGPTRLTLTVAEEEMARWQDYWAAVDAGEIEQDPGQSYVRTPPRTPGTQVSGPTPGKAVSGPTPGPRANVSKPRATGCPTKTLKNINTVVEGVDAPTPSLEKKPNADQILLAGCGGDKELAKAFLEHLVNGWNMSWGEAKRNIAQWFPRYGAGTVAEALKEASRAQSPGVGLIVSILKKYEESGIYIEFITRERKTHDECVPQSGPRKVHLWS